MSAGERAELTSVLEDFILSQACADADTLTAVHGLDVPVHVNVSAGRLVRSDLHAVMVGRWGGTSLLRVGGCSSWRS